MDNFSNRSTFRKDIKIIDSSVVNIGKGLAPELYHLDKKSAIRISTLFLVEEICLVKLI